VLRNDHEITNKLDHPDRTLPAGLCASHFLCGKSGMNQENRPGSVDELARLYRDTILRHATHPVGYQAAINVTHQCEKYNPLCGDRITILLEIDGSRIAATAFEGEACAICMASASLLCEELADNGADEVQRRLDWLIRELGSAPGEEDSEGYDSLKPLLGVRRYPSRTRCALLPWEAASGALENETL